MEAVTVEVLARNRIATKRKKSPVVDTDSVESMSEPDQRVKLRSTHKGRVTHPATQPTSDRMLTEYQSSEIAEPCSNPEMLHSGMEGKNSRGGKADRSRKRTKRSISCSLRRRLWQLLVKHRRRLKVNCCRFKCSDVRVLSGWK